MWGFNRGITLKESDFFNGLTDWHSHLLPGVDDGIKFIDDSIVVLRELEKLGVKKVWLTPHIMEEFPNDTSELKKRFNELEFKWTGNIELALASENMLDNLFEHRLEKNDFIPIGENKNSLLVETSYFNPPIGMDNMLKKARNLGYYIILAHPERYMYMNEREYIKLKEKGILFQLNYLSLVGAYGESAKRKAEWLLENGMVSYLGGDIHRFENLELVSNKKLSKKIITLLTKEFNH